MAELARVAVHAAAPWEEATPLAMADVVAGGPDRGVPGAGRPLRHLPRRLRRPLLLLPALLLGLALLGVVGLAAPSVRRGLGRRRVRRGGRRGAGGSGGGHLLQWELPLRRCRQCLRGERHGGDGRHGEEQRRSRGHRAGHGLGHGGRCGDLRRRLRRRGRYAQGEELLQRRRACRRRRCGDGREGPMVRHGPGRLKGGGAHQCR
mmetsp:Transcript_3210/g.9313  ORF Transcript_3210/g.9313 Transcript_3210/m.9313 type:complete len:205 (+) Transcript_3210:887-1501(+)